MCVCVCMRVRVYTLFESDQQFMNCCRIAVSLYRTVTISYTADWIVCVHVVTH
jgi:hypothetical protein